MAIKLHHLIVPAKDKRASAQLFAEIFDLTVKPSEGRFAQVPVDEHLTIDFAADEHTRGILHFVPEQLRATITLFTSRMRSSTASLGG